MRLKALRDCKTGFNGAFHEFKKGQELEVSDVAGRHMLEQSRGGEPALVEVKPQPKPSVEKGK